MRLLFFLLVLLGIAITGCTPYGSTKDEISTLTEYRRFLTQQYENREKPEVIASEIEEKMDDMAWLHELGTKESEENTPINLKGLYKKALQYSNQIKVFSDIPIIRGTGIMEAEGAFDPIVFAEGGYDRTHRAVGNILEVGNNQQRLKENLLYIEFGVRKKFAPGTEIEIKQRLEKLRSNSIFLDPNPQSVATLNIAIIQPLLRKAGFEYNDSPRLLAELDTEIAKNEFHRQMESHLLAITRAYWALYTARVELTLRNKMYNNVENIYREMKQRGDIDALQSEIYYCEAQLAAYKARMIRVRKEVRNSEERLFSLINAPEFKEVDIKNFVPHDMPITAWNDIRKDEAIKRALYYRPEMEQTYLQIRAATVRLNMAKNELLPMLNGIVEFSLSGIRADNDISGAISDEFDEGNVGALVGFEFEFPVPNRTARARHQRRDIEKRQLLEQFKTTAEGILFEVGVSVREVRTAYQAFVAQKRLYNALDKEVESLSKRRVVDTVLQGGKTSGFLQLLLQTQSRLLDAQLKVVKSVVDYNLALTNLKKSQGVFLTFEDVQLELTEDKDGIPKWKTLLNKDPQHRFQIFKRENKGTGYDYHQEFFVAPGEKNKE